MASNPLLNTDYLRSLLIHSFLVSLKVVKIPTDLRKRQNLKSTRGNSPPKAQEACYSLYYTDLDTDFGKNSSINSMGVSLPAQPC